MNKFTFVDLFAGCGGFSLGLKNAGLQPVWAIEIDPDASLTYKKNLGDHIVVGDIAAVDPYTLPEADVLVGGFPCQPFSISGLQNGFDGKDGDLFHECVRFIEAIKPKVFILENVQGFLSLKGGQYLKHAIHTLSNLGYHVSYRVLDAADFGVPQNRKRLFIMGNNLGVENIYPIGASSPVTVKDAIDDIRQNMAAFNNNEPMRHTDRIKKRFAAVRPGESALDAMKRDPSLGTAKITKQCYRRLYPNQPAPTIVANFVTTTIHYEENRNLTAREAARIQSFPDDFIFLGRKTRMSWQKELSQFEQIGNAVAPKVAQMLGAKVIEMLSGSAPMIEKSSPINNAPVNQLNFHFNDIEKEKKQKRKRGRRSRFEDIYSEFELLSIGDKLEVPANIDESFFVFLNGAMHRRRIKFEVNKPANSDSIEIIRVA